MRYGLPVTLRVVVVVRPLILFANISNNNKRLTNAKGGYRRRAIHPRPKETGFFAHLDKKADLLKEFAERGCVSSRALGTIIEPDLRLAGLFD